RENRCRRQRLGGGGQPERGAGVPGDRQPPDAGRGGLRLPRAGTHHRRSDRRDHRQARGHPQLADEAADQTEPPGRRVCAERVRIQLSGRHREATCRGDGGASPQPEGGVLNAAARRSRSEVYLRVMTQLAMVMNLDKCIGCHTCSVTCKQAWTNRPGTEYVWFNNVETRPGQGYPRTYEDQERWRGGWVRDRRGRLRLRDGGRFAKLLRIFANPKMPSI